MKRLPYRSGIRIGVSRTKRKPKGKAETKEEPVKGGIRERSLA
jgi:hypothetical protein